METQASREGQVIDIWLPYGEQWPDEDCLKEGGIDIVERNTRVQLWRVSAQPWLYQGHDPFEEVYQGKLRRRLDEPKYVQADPLIATLGYPTYRSEAQSMAVRHIFYRSPEHRFWSICPLALVRAWPRMLPHSVARSTEPSH